MDENKQVCLNIFSVFSGFFLKSVWIELRGPCSP